MFNTTVGVSRLGFERGAFLFLFLVVKHRPSVQTPTTLNLSPKHHVSNIISNWMNLNTYLPFTEANIQDPEACEIAW